jgi:3-oxoacyl-[acyl-carrier protein] reductase
MEKQHMSQQTTRPIAIVTGASRQRSIGTAVCRTLAQSGVDIFFTHWSPYDRFMQYQGEEETPAHLQNELRAMGVRCEQMSVDLSDVEAPRRILDAVEERLGAASILVNNAVHDEDEQPFDQLTAATLDKFYAINMRGTLLLSIEFARRFAQSMGGRIINLSSGQGVGAMPGKLPYVATKGAIEAFTVTLAAELASRGITVNAIDPGATDTGWMTEEIKQALLPHAPMGRLGQAEDAARLIRFLASEEAGWITGQIIHSRGGM